LARWCGKVKEVCPASYRGRPPFFVMDNCVIG
jgi:hypothetical protein